MPYKIISKIASGTFETVYKVQESTNGEFFALKLIHENYKIPKELKRIKRGFNSAKKVSSPNCVNMVEWYENGDDVGFVMEFVEGEQISVETQNVGNKNFCSLQEQITKIIQIANGLEALHSKGIVHRNLKPSNILETKEGQIKITDFDLVKTQEPSTIINSNTFLETVKFSSPEQCKDSSEIDHRSDLYSLGIIFYKLLTDRFPFDGDSLKNIILGHIRTPLISPSQFNPEIPIEIENIIKKLLSKNRNDRFNSAKEVIERLNKFLETPTEAQTKPPKVFQSFELDKEIDKDLILESQKLNQNLKIKSQFQELGIVIGNTPQMRKVFEETLSAVEYNFPVYIFGETGTGKELVANAIHKLSDRKDNPFIKVNCSTIPKDMAESELFGHQKGAFTGAISDRKGVFELAEGGTIFFDEVGDLSLGNQVKLLRVIEEKKIHPLGSEIYKSINVRILVATHKNLEKEVLEGNFREDLLHRLDVLKISLPPLRERKDDIPLLVNHILEKFNIESGKEIKVFPVEILMEFENYDWKGNIRELENRIIKALVKKKKNVPLTLQDFKFLNPKLLENSKQVIINEPKKMSNEEFVKFVGRLDGETIYEKLATVEKEIIIKALNESNWNKSKVSVKLGISRMQVNRIIARFKLKKNS